jgi:hypothetical protein
MQQNVPRQTPELQVAANTIVFATQHLTVMRQAGHDDQPATSWEGEGDRAKECPETYYR